MQTQSEKSIQNATLLALGCRDDVMIWRNHTGTFRHISEPEKLITVGTPGAPDALAVVAVTITPEMVGQVIGVAVGVEFKAANGRQSQKQKYWQEAFARRGGLYVLARSADDVAEAIKSLQHGR